MYAGGQRPPVRYLRLPPALRGSRRPPSATLSERLGQVVLGDAAKPPSLHAANSDRPLSSAGPHPGPLRACVVFYTCAHGLGVPFGQHSVFATKIICGNDVALS